MRYEQRNTHSFTQFVVLFQIVILLVKGWESQFQRLMHNTMRYTWFDHWTATENVGLSLGQNREYSGVAWTIPPGV